MHWRLLVDAFFTIIMAKSWLRGTVVERQSLARELSLSHARLAADG